MLGQAQPDGSTLRDHLQAAARMGQPDPLLDGAPPEGCTALWDAYCDLSAMRPSGMGLSAIPGAEIESWQRLTGVRFTPWEVGTLQAMDRAALAVMAAAAKSKGTQ